MEGADLREDVPCWTGRGVPVRSIFVYLVFVFSKTSGFEAKKKEPKYVIYESCHLRQLKVTGFYTSVI